MISSREAADPAPTPGWIAPWLTILAPVYLVSPLSILALPSLKSLPTPAIWILIFYAVSQQVPALFAPEPIIASLLALFRTLLMFGLIGIGVSLRKSQNLKPVLYGLSLVYVTSLTYSVVGGASLFSVRLSHPYMTSITVGLAGAIGIWLAMFLKGQLWWRLPFGLFSIIILIFSGSRGPLLAALIGIIGGFIVQRSKKTAALIISITLLFGAAIYIGNQAGLSAVTRLISSSTTGRDIIWSDTLTVIHAYPLGGVGSYRLGKYLTPPDQSCTLFNRTNNTSPDCSQLFKEFGNPWLIAHNVALQQIAETGPLGFSGLITLFSIILASAIKMRDSLAVSIICGILMANITDNTTLIPSPFFSELFWITSGIILSNKRYNSLNIIPHFSILLLGSLFPIIMSYFANDKDSHLDTLVFLSAPKYYQNNDYLLAAQIKLPQGDYRINIQTCLASCVTTYSSKVSALSTDSSMVVANLKLLDTKEQDIRLQIFKGESGFAILPYSAYQWHIKRQK